MTSILVNHINYCTIYRMLFKFQLIFHILIEKKFVGPCFMRNYFCGHGFNSLVSPDLFSHRTLLTGSD